MLKRQKQNITLTQLKNCIKEAYKKGNISRLNDISEAFLDLIGENQQFRILNRHLEPQPLYLELNQHVNLYSQILKLISRLEFMK